MTNTAQLPWDDSDGKTTVRTDGGDMHARATGLAVAAMNAVTGTDVDVSQTSYGRAQARYEAELAEIRAENARRHVENNNRIAAEAAARKAERQAAHQARNEAARQAANDRKVAKAV